MAEASQDSLGHTHLAEPNVDGIAGRIVLDADAVASHSVHYDQALAVVAEQVEKLPKDLKFGEAEIVIIGISSVIDTITRWRGAKVDGAANREVVSENTRNGQDGA